MVSFCRRLHRVFITPTTSSSSTPSPLPLVRTFRSRTLGLGRCPSFQLPEKIESLSISRVVEMLEQRSPRDLVGKFNELSAIPKFRRHERFYFAAAKRLADSGHFQWIEAMIEEQKKYRSISVESFVVRLLCVFGQSGMFEHALKLFDEMPSLGCSRTVHTYNALLSACVHSKRFDRFDTLFSEVAQKLDVKPGLISYNTKMMALCQMGRVDSWLSVIDEMEKDGIRPDAMTLNLVMDKYYNSGRFSNGESLWEIMEKRFIKPTIWSYNAKIRGLILEKRLEDALVVFDQLGTKRLLPDVSSYNYIIQGWCEVGKDLEKSIEWLAKMGNARFPPSRQTCEALVELACEVGNFDCAADVCYRAIRRRYVLKEVTLQGLVDGLVKQGIVGKADELVRMIRRVDVYANYEVKLSSDDDDD